MAEVKKKTQVAKVNPGRVSAESLIAKGIDKGMPLETMEKLLAMRRELKVEWAQEQFFAALSKFQRDCPIIVKSTKVDYTSRKGSRVKYDYASLDAIVAAVKEPLEQYGFSYTVTTKQDKESVTAICNVHHVDGHSETTEFTIPIDPESYMNAAQKVASALTYAKRYSFCNAFGILTGESDDDARALSENGEEKSQATTPPADAPKHDIDWYVKQIMSGLQKMFDKGWAEQEAIDSWMARLDVADDTEKVRDLLNELLAEYKKQENKHITQQVFDGLKAEEV